jgi:hypothetical protein
LLLRRLLKNSADILILIGSSSAPFGQVTTIAEAAPLLWKITFFQKIILIPPSYQLSKETPSKVLSLLKVDQTAIFWDGGQAKTSATTVSSPEPSLCALVLTPSRKVYNRLKKELKTLPSLVSESFFNVLKRRFIRLKAKQK